MNDDWKRNLDRRDRKSARDTGEDHIGAERAHSDAEHAYSMRRQSQIVLCGPEWSWSEATVIKHREAEKCNIVFFGFCFCRNGRFRNSTNGAINLKWRTISGISLGPVRIFTSMVASRYHWRCRRSSSAGWSTGKPLGMRLSCSPCNPPSVPFSASASLRMA